MYSSFSINKKATLTNNKACVDYSPSKVFLPHFLLSAIPVICQLINRDVCMYSTSQIQLPEITVVNYGFINED